MIIKYQQFAKTNTFSLSFHILFSPFLHIFPQDTSKSGFGDGQKWGWPPQKERERKIGRETGVGERYSVERERDTGEKERERQGRKRG